MQGTLDLEAILKCNKVKVLTQDKTVLAKALEGSKKVALNPERTGVIRVGNPPVPELEKSGKRKMKEEEDKANAEYILEKDLDSP